MRKSGWRSVGFKRFALPVAAVALLFAGVSTASASERPAAAPSRAAAATARPSVPARSHSTSRKLSLHRVAAVDLGARQAGRAGFGRTPGEHYTATDPDRGSVFTAGGGRTGKLDVSDAKTVTAGGTNGTVGFAGVSGPSQAAVNGDGDLEPPDQGLCSNGNTTLEFVNNALEAYTTAGQSLAGPIASYTIFGQPSSDFFADPRCYYDAPTQRWFLTEFIAGSDTNGVETSPSTQYIAVSDTSAALGSYHVYSIDTTDPTTSGCPCFGDYDQIGANANGFYISTNEFGESSGAFNGTDIFALPLQTLEHSDGIGASPPSVTEYRLISDAFSTGASSGPYHVAPASTPPGGTAAPDTEYFVESNSTATSGDHLVVYALRRTNLLGSATAGPTLTSVELASEAYAFPPDANQKAGPLPLGASVKEPEGELQADFNAIQEVTYTGGELYAELDTATAGNKDGIAWFVLTPTLTDGVLGATVSHQGYVTVAGENLLYPDIAVDRTGNGFLVFSMTGAGSYPSAMDMPFAPTGPQGSVHTVAAGAGPEDGFTCYAAFVGKGYGGCRWGDYSMGVAAAGRIFMAAEYVPPTARDFYTNWGTYVWSAPTP